MPPDSSLDAKPLGLVQLHTAAEQLWLEMQAEHPGFSIDVLPSVASTNTYLMQLGKAALRTGTPLTPTAAVAWHQQAGKGNHGRSWASIEGASLTLSLAYPLHLDWTQSGTSALSLAMGVEVCEALRHACPALPAQLKWPNDVWVSQRKLAGLLIEVIHRSPPDQLAWVVVGLGVNVTATPPELINECCDISMFATATPADVMRWVLPRMMHGLGHFEREGFAKYQDRYAQLDALAGRDMQLWAPSAQKVLPQGSDLLAQGQACGVNREGALLIRDTSGSIKAWPLGEASVRPISA